MPGDYAADDLMVMSSIPAFVSFLKTVRHEVPAVRLHVVAHSMGCRLVTGSLMAEAASGSNVTVTELLLAAPDIDADSFRRVNASTIAKSAVCVTLYVSARDQSLAIARSLHGERVRLGDASEGIGILPGIDIVDVRQAPNEKSGICTGHSYYATYGPLRAVVVEGLGHSDLDVESRAFFRSDHYAFALLGIPTVYVFGFGIAPSPDDAEPELDGVLGTIASVGGSIVGLVDVKRRADNFLAHHHHQTSDIVRPEWDWQGVRTTAVFYLWAGSRIANGDSMPQWRPTSEYNRPRGTRPTSREG